MSFFYFCKCGGGFVPENAGTKKVNKHYNVVLIAFIAFFLTSCGSKYQKKDGKIYYYHSLTLGLTDTIQIPEADYNSFKGINYLYAKDDKNVYCRGKIIPGANPKTFEPVKNDLSKDNKNVYFRLAVMALANPKTFKATIDGCSTDGQHIYDYHGDLQKDIYDAASYKFLDDYWGKDNFYYYTYFKRIDGIDYKSFSIINQHYAKDNRNVYYRDNSNVKIIKNADPKTFKVWNYGYWGKDKNNCYDGDEIIDCNSIKKGGLFDWFF